MVSKTSNFYLFFWPHEQAISVSTTVQHPLQHLRLFILIQVTNCNMSEKSGKKLKYLILKVIQCSLTIHYYNYSTTVISLKIMSSEPFIMSLRDRIRQLQHWLNLVCACVYICNALNFQLLIVYA